MEKKGGKQLEWQAASIWYWLRIPIGMMERKKR